MAHDDQKEREAAVLANQVSDAAARTERRIAFGARLKAAREGQELSVTGLGQMTRISVVFIDALEAGDFARLPGAVFGRGFVRSIARTTGLTADDAVQLVTEFDDLWERGPAKSVLKVEIKNKPNLQRGEAFAASLGTAGSLLRRGLGTKLAIPAVLACAVAVAFAASPGLRSTFKDRLFKGGAASVATTVKTIDLAPAVSEAPVAVPEAVVESTAKEPVDSTAVESTVVPTATGAETAASGETVAAPVAPAVTPEVAVVKGDQVLELTVTETVRVRIEVDNGQAVTKELEPDNYRFTFASKADLMVYDAAALKVTYNGRPLGSLGAKGRVRRLSFEAALAEPQKL